MINRAYNLFLNLYNLIIFIKLEEENEDTTPNYFEFVKDMTLWLGDAGLFSFVVTICRKAL